MANMAKPNMSPLKEATKKAFSFDQQQVYNARGGFKGHSTAVLIEFDDTIGGALAHGQGQGYQERLVRLVESLNRPETIKADFWSITPNGGIVPGIVFGHDVGGTPMGPAEFFKGLGYQMILTVHAGNSANLMSALFNGVPGDGESSIGSIFDPGLVIMDDSDDDDYWEDDE